MTLLRVLLLPYIVFVFGSAFWAKILKKKIVQVLPFYLMASALIVYIFGLFHQLWLGYYFVAIASVVSEILLLIWYMRKKKLSQLLKEQCDYSFWIMSGTYLLVFVLNINRIPSWWDDYMHWAPFAEETYRIKDFYAYSPVITIHRDYPPIITVYRVFWTFLAGGFNDAYLYMANVFFIYSLLMAFLPKVSKKDVAKNSILSFIILISFLVVPIIVQSETETFTHTLYVDVLLALITAFSLAQTRQEKKFGISYLVKMSIAFSFLMLLKQISPFFIFFVITYAIVRIIVTQKEKLRKISILLFALILPCVLMLAWRSVVKAVGAESQFSVLELVSETKDLIFAGNSALDQLKRDVINLYLDNSAYEKPLVFGLRYIPLILVTIVGTIYCAKYKKNNKDEALCFLSVSLVFAVLYFIVLGLMYLTIFGIAEALLNESYSRYASTIWQAIAFCIFMISLSGTKFERLSDNPKLAFIPIFIIVAFSNLYTVQYMTPNDDAKHYYEKAISMISSSTTEEDRIYIVQQEFSPKKFIYLRYKLMPRITNLYDVERHLHVEDYPGDYYVQTRNAEEFKEDLENYQYLYIAGIDDGFIERYSVLFQEEPVEGGLYKVTENGLEFVGQEKIRN